MYIVSVGLIVCDIITNGVDRNIFEGDTSRIEKTVLRCGGDAYNVAYNAAALGAESKLVECVGNDYFGEFTVGQAKARGVDVTGVKAVEGCETSTSVVLVERSGERHILFNPGANSLLSFKDIGADVIKKAAAVHLGSSMALKDMDNGGTEKLFGLAKEKGVLTCMDVTYDSEGVWLNKIETSLRLTDVFVPSFGEARVISGRDRPEGMAEFFKEFGIKYFIVKLGKDGCFVTDYNRSEYIKSLSTNVVDTTGAGDCFTAGMLSRLIKGADVFESARFGQKAAAFCVAHVGSTGFDMNI